MKKLLFLAAAVAAMLTSCSKEQVVGVSTIYAIFANDDATKVVMGPSDGTNTPLNWNAGDCIAVYNAISGTFGEYITSSSVHDGDERAEFSFYYMGSEIIPSEPHLAAYPYERIHPNTFAFKYNSTQTYTENSFDRLAMPMVAVNMSGNSFTFNPQAAVLRLKVSTTSSDITVNSIEITSANKYLVGWAAADLINYIYEVPVESAAKTVTLECNTPVAINSTAKDFNIVVPGQTYPSGDLTITVNTNKGTIVKTSKADATFVAGKVYNINVSGTPTM